MAFAGKNTPVIVLENEHRSDFFLVALKAMGHDVHIVPCKDVVDEALEIELSATPLGFQTRNRDMRVDIDVLGNIVRSLI